MGSREYKPTHITAEEVMEKYNNIVFLHDIRIGCEIMEKFTRTSDVLNGDREWLIMTACGAIFAAGRIQGVREERAKRKPLAAAMDGGRKARTKVDFKL